jgi:hypothetical protein
MAKVWDYQGRTSYPIVVEDPRAGNDGFFLDGMKHDKTSLTPQFNRFINYQDSTSTAWETKHNNNISTSGGHVGQSLALSKLQTGMSIPTDNTQNHENWVDPASWIDMSQSGATGEGGHTGGAMRVLTNNDGSVKAVTQVWESGNTAYNACWPEIEDSVDLDESIPNARGNSWTDDYGKRYHFWGKSYGSNNYQVALSRGDNGSNNENDPHFQMKVGYSQWPSNWASQYSRDVTSMGAHWTPQFLGESVDGGLLFAGNQAGTSASGSYVRVSKEVWTSSQNPTGTQMFYYSATPPAAGSHQGGFNMNSKEYASNFSEHFDDPRGVAGTNRCFYTSYYDTYYNWHPQLVTWDRSTDTFALEHDITTDVNSSTHADLSTVSSDTSSQKTAQWSVTTWVSDNQRYVSEFRVDGRYTYWDTNEGFRTWVTYAVDAANPKTLTYHSKITMPTTPRQWVWLNDSHTMIGVWFTSAFRVYAWNNSTGWTETSTVGGYIHECGRDSLDRIWYTKPSSVYGGNYPELHLLTPTLPVSITVTPENANYTYSGSDISTFVNVSAVNASGTRIATSVKLVIEGSSMTFADGTTQKTVTTLSTGELQVNTTITGAGFTNIAASVEI